MAQCPPPTDESIRIFILKIQDPLPTFIGSDVQLRPHTPGSMWKSSVSVPMTSLSYVQPLSDVEPDVEQIQFDQKHFIQVAYSHGNYLLAVRKPENRLKILSNERWCSEITTIQTGYEADFTGFQGQGETNVIRTRVKVHFVGALEGQSGLRFGIELPKEHTGKGTTDGVFRNKRHFRCAKDCGLFVSIYQIRSCEKIAGSHLPGYTPWLAHKECLVGKRVAWPKEENQGRETCNMGTVRWEGYIGNITYKMVGVEFDHPIGKGSGKVQGIQLFVAKQHHALLMPANALILQSHMNGAK